MSAAVSPSMSAVLSRISTLEAQFGLRRATAAPVSGGADFETTLAGALRPAGATGSSAAAGTTASAAPSDYDALFAEAGARYGVDPALLAAVARTESGMNPRAVSPAGAQGLMQLMPQTAAGLGVSDPFDPAQAVDGAARLLRSHLDRFGSVDLALAAYNAGAGAVRRHGGIPPYAETQAYVRRVTEQLGATS